MWSGGALQAPPPPRALADSLLPLVSDLHLIWMLIGAAAGLEAGRRDYYSHKSRRFNGPSDSL